MTPADFEQISYSVFENVATVTLNRPQRRNAWTGQMAIEYRWALHTADHDPAVGAIVITGAGDWFSIGADLEILDEVNQNGGAYRRLAAEYGLAWTLTRIVGQQNALEILLANPVMSGDQAKELGFVRSSVPAAEFARHVHEFARNLAWHSSPSSLKVMKRQIYLDAWADL